MERLIVKELTEMINNSIIKIYHKDKDSNYGNFPIDVVCVEAKNFDFVIYKLMYSDKTIKYVMDNYTGIIRHINPSLPQNDLKQLFDLGMARYNEYFAKSPNNLLHLYKQILNAKTK